MAQEMTQIIFRNYVPDDKQLLRLYSGKSSDGKNNEESNDEVVEMEIDNVLVVMTL